MAAGSRATAAAAAASVLQYRRVHLIGVGGAGMSGIARILIARGVAVSGSDAKDSRALIALAALGADVSVGHDAANIGAAEAVVISSAIRSSNVELVAAQERGLPVLPRAAALAGVMADRRGVAIAGTHGKTTTTSMLTVALQHCGADPSFAIGGDLNEPGSNAHWGTGEIFVAEADESDESFLLLRPDVAVVTNVEPDHLDHYGDPLAVEAAFTRFVAGLRADATLVVCADDAAARRVAAAASCAVRTYGLNADADLHIDALALSGTTSAFDITTDGQRLGRVQLGVPGRHNAVNAAGALAAALALGYAADDLIAGLSRFAGVRRRFELKGQAAGVRVYDSYAHHPTEVRADLAAAREVAGDGRVIAVFQPHLYSRTRAFAAEFGAALGAADDVVVTEVYGAREDPVPGVSGAQVAAAVTLPAGHVRYEPSFRALAQAAAALAHQGDIVLTMGAGDITLLAPEVLTALGGSDLS
ncbi:MAG: UDP-N-acetylmuramate--L-alanine ligase [Mycobacteriales bacterium]|nr:UDP-N-acetylmuramate--L-alanine ligase [Frankia sp.]